MRTIVRLGTLALGIALGASACHVGGGYTVGGTVTGLRVSGLVLQDNGGDGLAFSSNGTFTFSLGHRPRRRLFGDGEDATQRANLLGA